MATFAGPVARSQLKESNCLQMVGTSTAMFIACRTSAFWIAAPPFVALNGSLKLKPTKMRRVPLTVFTVARPLCDTDAC